MVLAGFLVIELGGSNIKADADLPARLISGSFNSVDNILEGVLIGLHLRSKAALIAKACGKTILLQDAFQCVIDFNTCAQGLMIGIEPVRGDHILLDVGSEIGMGAAIHNIHVRYREDMPVGAANVTVQRQVSRLCRRIQGSKGYTEDSICAKAALIRGTVKLDHGFIKGTLVSGVHTNDLRGDLFIYSLNSIKHALALVTGLIAVAALPCLSFTGRSA